MLSIVICSTKSEISEEFHQNILNTIGLEFELIVIDNSNKPYSIFEAYNLGLKKASYGYLCFVHEDVMFRTYGWGERVIQHLCNKDTGFIGIAGGPIMPVVPSSWIGTYSVFNLLQSDKHGKKKTKRRVKPVKYNKSKYQVVVLDGVFLCARKEIFEYVAFDEKFAGFHCYDLDICIQSHLKGYSNYVVYDILLEHFSRGNRDKSYYENLLGLYKKWNSEFPLVTDERRKFYINNSRIIERRKLKNLIAELATNSFHVNDVRENIRFYFDKIKSGEYMWFRFYMKFYIYIKCFINKK